MLSENAKLRRETGDCLRVMLSLRRDIKALLMEGKPIQESVEDTLDERRQMHGGSKSGTRAVDKFLNIAHEEDAVDGGMAAENLLNEMKVSN